MKKQIKESAISATPDRFVVKRPRMISASGEVEVREFNMVVDKTRGVAWFYTLEDYDPAGHIYCHHYNAEHSQGFGGRTIVFKIGKSAQYHARGPWHSNSDSLFQSTGVDLRDKHLTFVCIARRRTYEGHDTVLEEILYIDKLPTLGKFERGTEMAQKYANELNHPIAYYSESTGGSSCGYEYPEGTTFADWKEYFNHEL